MKEIVEQGKILEIRIGSHLYGLNTPNSDEDYLGVFLAPVEYHFGLHELEQLDLSVVSKLESGKNSKEAVDRIFYELKRFTKLALENNPNILEVLFVNEENIVYINEYGRRLLSLKYDFLSEKVIKTFLGYATSQKRKLITKKSNLEILFKVKNFLEKYEEKRGMILPELKDEVEFSKLFILKGVDIYKIGEYKLNKNVTVKEALKKVNEIIFNSTNRQDLILKYGYDTKFAYHLVRILLELKEIIQTGDLIFPLREKELLFKIKTGKFSLEEVEILIEDLEEEIEKILETEKKLMEKPNVDKIEKEIINIYMESMKKEEIVL